MRRQSRTNSGIVYDNVMDIIGDERFNVFLNPGHHTATDEWVNSPFYQDSPTPS